MGMTVALMAIIGIAYYMIAKKMQKSEYKKIQKLQKGTKSKQNVASQNINQKV